uniref:Uncharacterized protein n=1 Tax=Panagrolaimus sp. ES5 TaxID=591445 RepID=A0AC34GRN6_9BILA
MPNEVVWVDKIINPRSVVLTYNEAMTVLKKAKVASGRSQFIAAECMPSTSAATIKIEDQKEECLKFFTLHANEMEANPIIKMQEELQSIAASKIAFDEAVNKNVLFPDGLPRLKPSLSLKKNIFKNQKNKKQTAVGFKLANVAGKAINKEAVKNLYKDNDEDLIVLSSSESETNAVEEPAIKRKRIVISDDEDIEDDVEQEPQSSSTKTNPVKSIEKAVVQSSNNGDVFKEAFTSCIDATSDDPITITFEANNESVNVIASSSNVYEIINDVEIPNNDMFTDEAVSSLLNLPTSSIKSSDEALQSFWFGTTKEQPGKLALINKKNFKISSKEMLRKLPYSELIKDEEFCATLLDVAESDIDVTPFLDMHIEKFSRESVYLPRQSQISMKNQLISHNTVIHEALKYLLKNKSTEKTSEEIKMAYDKLKKYPLTFLEKFNLITTMPKDLSGILCLLDDLGLRFGKESLEKLEADCTSLFGKPEKKEAEEESEKIPYDPEVAKKVRFSKTVEHRFL